MPQDNPFPMLGGLTFSEDVFYRILDDVLGAGVVGATDYQVIQNHLGANMSVDVQPGSAYVLFTSVAGGKRRTRLPAQSNSGTPGSPNSADKWLTTFVAADVTNPRIDRVVLTVRDTAVDGSGASDSALRVIAGTPTAGATLVNLNGAAAIPANSILLANVLVPANATTVITANIDATVVPRARIASGNVLAPAGPTTYRKTSAKAVVNSVAETDLLNGEITIGAGVVGANGAIRLTATGDLVNNTGANQTPPRFKLKFGATTLVDSNAPAANMGFAANRLPWRVDVIIQNLGLTNSQWAMFKLQAYMANSVGANVVGVIAGAGLTFLETINGGFGEMHSLIDGTSTIDTTVANLLQLTVINGVANAAYDVTLRQALVEIV